jgi:hypothetical protein
MINFRLLLPFSIVTAMLIGCSGAEETPNPTAEPVAVVSTNTPEPAEPSPTVEPVEPTVTNTAEPAATVVPTAAPTNTPEEAAVAAFDGDECLICHTDKDRLIETAALVEEVPSESSGVG